MSKFVVQSSLHVGNVTKHQFMLSLVHTDVMILPLFFYQIYSLVEFNNIGHNLNCSNVHQ